MSTPRIFSAIESALRKSGRLHGFRSGGGLRVFHIDGPDISAYGEHPSADEALRILADDIEVGGRTYSEVYGKTEAHYLTGRSEPTSELDGHLLYGHTIDTWFEDGQFVTKLSGRAEWELPKVLHERALDGETITWTDTHRQVIYHCTPIRFANGKPDYITQVLSRPAGMPAHRVWMWKTVRRGVGDSFLESMTRAFAARAVEVED